MIEVEHSFGTVIDLTILNLLVIFRGCPQAYHPSCVNRDEAFFRAKGRFNCGKLALLLLTYISIIVSILPLI